MFNRILVYYNGEAREYKIFEGKTILEAQNAYKTLEIPQERERGIKILRDNQSDNIEGTGKSYSDAVEVIQKLIPFGAYDNQPSEIIKEGTKGLFEIQAETETKAREILKNKVPQDAIIDRVELITPPKEGVMGIGKRLGTWRFSWSTSYRVKLSYKLPAQIIALFVPAIQKPLPTESSVLIVNGYEIKPKAELQGAQLIEANLEGVNLEGSDLRHANLRLANLRKCCLRHSNLSGALLGDTDLSEADLRDTDLSNVEMRCSNLEKAQLSGANLDNAVLDGANLSDTDINLTYNLPNASMIEDEKSGMTRVTRLNNINFTKYDLHEIRMVGAWSIKIIFCEANLQNANLQGVNFTNADFSYANLQGAWLRYANFPNAIFYKSNLQYADLQASNLESANFEGADLRNCDLSGQETERTVRETNLKKANLQSADLRGANLSNVNLEGANIENTNFEGAILKKTTMPDGKFRW